MERRRGGRDERRQDAARRPQRPPPRARRRARAGRPRLRLDRVVDAPRPSRLVEAVDAHDEPRVVPLDLDRRVARGGELLVGVEAAEHPADRRRRIRLLLAVDRAGDDQPLLRAGHRDVVEAELLGLLLRAARLAHLVVVERAAALRRHGIGDAEAEAPVGEREDLVGRRRRLVAAGVGDDHDLELEPLRRMDREQPHGVGALLLGDRLELARADRLLLGDEADEALDVGAAQLLVRAREPRELAHVRVAAAAVPLREHGEVVVVLADDALAQPLEREPRHRVARAGRSAAGTRAGAACRARRAPAAASARCRRRAAASTPRGARARAPSFEMPTNGDASTVRSAASS